MVCGSPRYSDVHKLGKLVGLKAAWRARCSLFTIGYPRVRAVSFLTLRKPFPGVLTPQVYLVTDQAGKRCVAKFAAVPHHPYPKALHEQLAEKGLTPALLEPPESLPGGFTLVVTEYLSPEEGWVTVGTAPCLSCRAGLVCRVYC